MAKKQRKPGDRVITYRGGRVRAQQGEIQTKWKASVEEAIEELEMRLSYRKG